MDCSRILRWVTGGCAACCAERLRLSGRRAEGSLMGRKARGFPHRRPCACGVPPTMKMPRMIPLLKEQGATVLGQRRMDQFSPRSGRHHVAHGESHGYVSAPPPPSPLPPVRERGAVGGVRGLFPRACALGHTMSPLAGLESAPSPPDSNAYTPPFPNPLLSRGREPFS